MASGKVPSVFSTAVKQWPVLGKLGIIAEDAPPQGDNMLESWPVGEPGTKSSPRPAAIPINKFGISVYSPKTRPIDILGDVVSHLLVKTNPKYQAYYSQFSQSLTPEQKTRLQQQYRWAVQNAGERRPYEKWLEMSGLPAYFRGYAFQQWPAEVHGQALYTPQQIQMFNQMLAQLAAPIEPFGSPAESVMGKNNQNKSLVQRLRGRNGTK